MPRIPDQDRLEIVDNHLAHYEQAIIVNGSAFDIETGFGRPQLLVLRNAFETLQISILTLDGDGGELQSLRSERDDLFGVSDTDEGGVWFWLKLYKEAVKARLGGKHPLTRSVPNLGKVQPQNYLDICQRFIIHWTRVNAGLASPLVLGAFLLATLTTARANLEAKIVAIDNAEITVSEKREQREQDFGDEPDDEREMTSIVAWLLKYHSVIQTKFPNQPIADSLPEIFPPGSPATLPTFPFNWSPQPGGVVRTWFAVAGAPAGTAIVFLKEGIVEVTAPFVAASAGGVQVNNWTGLTVIGELDQFELRNGSGTTIAHGVRNPALAPPV